MIVVIADDLSGATELAALANAHGLSAEVQTKFDPRVDARVVAVDADSRTCSREESIARVRAAARRVLEAKPEWIYKKTDSVLRGHVRSEISELLALTGKKRALLIPANPGRGRIVHGGHYFVDGLALEKTVFANDPDYPATNSSVFELLSREPGAELSANAIHVPDVQSAEDVARWVRTVDEKTLCAGASEFFAALLPPPLGEAPALGNADGSTLFVCGSAAAWPARERQCIERGIPVFAGMAVSPDAVARAIETSGTAAVGIGLAGIPATISSRQLEEMLAETTHSILDRTRVERLFLEGGATAAAVLRKMEATRLAVGGHFAKGIAAFRIPGREFPLLGIKPGSYAWPENVWPRRASLRSMERKSK